MKKYYLTALIIIFYYFFNFFFSIIFITDSVANNNSIKLKEYINTNSLKKNFYDDIYINSRDLIKLSNKEISIKKNSFELKGELTESFIESLFHKISKNAAEDFSTPEILLYFYFNSNEISEYIKEQFVHLGEYNFEKYIINKQAEEKVINNNIEEEILEKEEVYEEIVQEIVYQENVFSKLLKRYNATSFFFFASPAHFKISARHQDIEFSVILKFNGLKWKINKNT